MHDARDLAAVQGASGVQGQQDRGRRLLLFTEKAVLVRQRQVHACRLHRSEGPDRARQLAFQATLEGQAFLELGLAEARVVHQLETDHAALGQAGRGQLQARVVDLRGRDQDRVAAVGMAVRNVHLRQLGDDGAAILLAQVGIQHFVVALLAPQRERDDDRHQAGDAQGQHQSGLGRHGRQRAAAAGRVSAIGLSMGGWWG